MIKAADPVPRASSTLGSQQPLPFQVILVRVVQRIGGEQLPRSGWRAVRTFHARPELFGHVPC